MQIRNVISQPAVFFTLDGVVRRIRPEVARDYMQEYGEVPPAPVHVGEQELILKVVDYIKAKCDETGAIPIALDMAPYVEGGVMPIDNYKNVLAETVVMLREAGLLGVKAMFCPHTPELVETWDETGTIKAVQAKPKCGCRFPNDGLIRKAAQVHGISVLNDIAKGAYRVLPPSFMIGNDGEARAASIERSSMSFTWVEGILNGSILYRDMTTHAHLKAAAVIREHQKQASERAGDGPIDVNARDLMSKMPELPSEYDRPAGT